MYNVATTKNNTEKMVCSYESLVSRFFLMVVDNND